jgi:hypothetical protein
MIELFVILGVLVILTLWIVGHNIYLWRTDVLSGSYIANDEPGPALADDEIATASEAAEQRRKTRAFLFGWSSDRPLREPRGGSEAHPIDSGDSRADTVTAAPPETVAAETVAPNTEAAKSVAPTK